MTIVSKPTFIAYYESKCAQNGVENKKEICSNLPFKIT
jgi:hypothetical protein